MLLRQLANRLQEELSDEVVFIITDNYQQYESYMKTKDEDKYTPAVITLTSNPFIFDKVASRIYNYRVELYGYTNERDKVESDIKKLAQKQALYIDDIGYMSTSEMFFHDTHTSGDGRNQRRFTAYFDVTVEVMLNTVAGNEWKVWINGEKVTFKNLFFNQDKSLIPNVEYGDNNNDVKMIAENINFELPVKAGIESTILRDVISSSFNKKYRLEMQIPHVADLKELDVVLRGGTANVVNNTMPSTYVARFQLALPRNTITIKHNNNVETLPLLSYNFDMKKGIQASARMGNDGVAVMRSIPESHTYTITATFTSNDTLVSNALKNDIESATQSYNVYEIDKDGKEYNVMLASGSYSYTENSDLYFNCSFIETEVI